MLSRKKDTLILINYESIDQRGLLNKTKIVIQYNGSPMQIMNQQKDLELKMRALGANERNIFKNNPMYWMS
jgi:hypothetical protein